MNEFMEFHPSVTTHLELHDVSEFGKNLTLLREKSTDSHLELDFVILDEEEEEEDDDDIVSATAMTDQHITMHDSSESQMMADFGAPPANLRGTSLPSTPRIMKDKILGFFHNARQSLLPKTTFSIHQTTWILGVDYCEAPATCDLPECKKLAVRVSSHI